MCQLELLKETICIYIVLISLSFSFCAGSCIGGDVEALEFNCFIISGKPLIITNKSNQTDAIKKLNHVTYIAAGIEILETDIVELSFPNLEVIKNPSGPAIIFRGNSKLLRFKAPKLEQLSGKPNELQFSNDNFIRAVFSGEDENSFLDFQKLWSASGRTSCSEDFYVIQANDRVELTLMDRWEITGVLVLIHVFVLSMVVVYCCLSKNRKLKLKSCCQKKKPAKKPEEKKKEPKPTSQSPKKSDSMQSEISKSTQSNQSQQSAPTPTSRTPTSSQGEVSKR